MVRKGFTLVELLAVIVILAIILAIAIPGISNVIESSKTGAAESDAKMLLKALEYKIVADEAFDPTTITEDNIEEVLGIDASKYKSLTVKKMNGQLYVTMVGKDKWDGMTISGTKKSIKVNDTIITYDDSEEIPNPPVLAPGMIPIKWVTNHWEVTTESDWYDYSNQEWANAITRDCEIVNGVPTNIETCSMWVWIPRYVYRIKPEVGDAGSGWNKDRTGIIEVQFSKGIDDNWNKDNPEVGPIDLREGAVASNALANGNKYTNHPAFTFGDTELIGFWVAKFEASSTSPGASNGGGNNTNLQAKSIPNVPSWRGINVSNIFTVTRAMETDNFYGWGNSGKDIDTHMIKNTEWGAVVYLSKSIYGKNATEIFTNPSTAFITGRGGIITSQANTTDNMDSFPTNLYGYDGRACSSKTGYICTGDISSTYGLASSTTGTIYGIYDMSGCAYEYVAAYVNNSYASTHGLNLYNADAKYKNVYLVGLPDTRVNNYQLTNTSKGDALFETSIRGESGGIGAGAWHSDWTVMPSTSTPWLMRSYPYSYANDAGTYGFDRSSGSTSGNTSFRPVLLVEKGL